MAAHLGRNLQVQRIIMACDHNPAIGGDLAGQRGDNVAKFDVFPDAATFGNLMRIETDLETRAEAFELVENPLAGGTDGAIGLAWIRESISRAEAFQFAENLSDPLLGYFRNDLLDQGIYSLKGQGSRVGLFGLNAKKEGVGTKQKCKRWEDSPSCGHVQGNSQRACSRQRYSVRLPDAQPPSLAFQCAELLV